MFSTHVLTSSTDPAAFTRKGQEIVRSCQAGKNQSEIDNDFSELEEGEE